MSESGPPPPRRWYRSLYWRIAAGFIAFLAVMLVAQVALFLWLSSQRDDLPPRLLANLAALVADELGAEAARTPAADLATLATARFEDLNRPAVLLLPDGRMVASSSAVPPESLRVATLWRLTSQDRLAWPPPRRPGNFGRRGPPGPMGPMRADQPDAGRPGRPLFSPGWAVAPVRVDDRVAAAVLVGRGRPPGAVARELAPWLAAGLAALLVAGTALASMAVFRPAHSRLSNLEDAARRFGDGDRSARASATGGDEVSAVARAFNRMADDAAAREAALVDADRARRQLLADVSHELRTPLTSIRGYAETLAVPGFAPVTPEGRHAVHVVTAEAQRLERLVNDLLDLARLDAGGAPLQITAVSVRGLFTRVLERHGPEAAAAGISLETDADGAAESVPGDAVRLEQVLQNLTANALRHVARGGHVHLTAARSGDEVVLRVTDDGRGIDAVHLPHVFDRFYKGDPSRTGGTGTGLGLSIVKAIVERHGGHVGVESTPGVGTAFEIRLPAPA
jgi:two-component system, OmpR family, sensor kinase